MWRLLGIALVSLLCLAAPAAAQTSAAGTISGSGTSWRLTVLNTGAQPIQCLSFTAAAGVQVTSATGPGTVLANPQGFDASGLAIGPDQTAAFDFTTTAPYPDNGGGTLLVSSSCTPGSDVPAQVSGPAPRPQPVAGRSEVVQVVAGVVRVRRRGSRRFVRVTTETLIPDRSEIDATRGTLRLTVDRGDGTTESADISEGRAIVDQDTSARPTTTLRLSAPLACRRAGGSAVAAAKKKRRKKRRLFATTDGGRFRTQGRYAAAVATGTAWRTIDTCRTTTIRVVEGTVEFTNLRTGRSSPLSAPNRRVVRRRAR
jgi:hypothetical protein